MRKQQRKRDLMMNCGYLYLLVTAFCWSLAGVFIRFNTQSGLMISCVGSGFALLFNLLFSKKKYIINRTVIVTAFIQVICGITFIYANQLTTVGNAIALQYTSMIFVVIYDCIDKKRKPSIQKLIIITIVVLGIVLFFMDSISVKGMIGNFLAIISGAFFGLEFYINTKKNADAYTSCNLSYIINLCFIIFIIQDFPTVSTKEWLAMLGSGIFQIAIGGIMFAKGIRYVDAFTANIICMFEIVLAPLWAFLLFYEKISLISLCGAVVIVCGILWNMYLEFYRSVQDG